MLWGLCVSDTCFYCWPKAYAYDIFRNLSKLRRRVGFHFQYARYVSVANVYVWYSLCIYEFPPDRLSIYFRVNSDVTMA